MPKELKHPISIIPFLSFHRHFSRIKKVLKNQEGRRKGQRKGREKKLRGVQERMNDHNKKYRPNSRCWAMSSSELNLFVKGDASFTKKK